MSKVSRFFGWGSLALLVATPIVFDAYKAFRPASEWMVVNKVFVHDAVPGSTPAMSVERQIHSNFTAEWVAEVHMRQPSGGYAAICTQSGRNEYSPGDRLPDDLDLNWWTYPLVCELGAGEYKIVTVWRIMPENYPVKRVQSVSNVFEVSS